MGRFIWTYELCKDKALMYSKKCDFQKFSTSAYNKALKMGWLDTITSHMKQNIHWSYELCRDEALKYKTKVEFKKKSGSAYVKACIEKWIDDICEHMTITGTLRKRCIYVAEFSDNYVYVGLTYSYNKRIKTHLIDENSSVYKHIKESTIIPKFKQITDYININNAVIKEEYYVNAYKTNGWKILNQTKTGTIGGNVLIWTKENCIKDAKKYKTKYEYFKKSTSSYQAAKRYGWFDEVCEHMPKNVRLLKM